MAKIGRPPHEPTPVIRAVVENLVAAGIPLPDIATRVGTSESTLKRYYRTEINTGAAQLHAELAEQAVAMARKGDKTMLIFVLKTRFGWREKAKDDDGQDGTTVTVRADSAGL